LNVRAGRHIVSFAVITMFFYIEFDEVFHKLIFSIL
jgi:hypothetical protein